MIYLQFLQSYLELQPSADLEKFNYFSSKFIRQIIKYLNEEIASPTGLTNLDGKKNEDTIRFMTIASELLMQILDLIKRYNFSILHFSFLVWYTHP